MTIKELNEEANKHGLSLVDKDRHEMLQGILTVVMSDVMSKGKLSPTVIGFVKKLRDVIR